jgi:hypothetical protein
MDAYPDVGWKDITNTHQTIYLTSPAQLVVRVEGTEAQLDAVAADSGNVELFREPL